MSKCGQSDRTSTGSAKIQHGAELKYSKHLARVRKSLLIPNLNNRTYIILIIGHESVKRYTNIGGLSM